MRGAGRRFAFGLFISLSLVLVAFEWRSQPSAGPRIVDPLTMEEPIVLPRVVVVVPEMKPVVERKKRTAPSPIIMAGEPDPTDPPDPGPEPDPDPEPGSGVEPDPGPPAGTEGNTGPTPPVIFEGVSRKPYFTDCMLRSPNSVNACTEDRISRHLQRHFRPPTGLRGNVRTMVFFEIDAEGHVGQLLFSPRVDAAIEREVERVLRALPVFVPGEQNGHAVPVFYRIPLVVRVG